MARLRAVGLSQDSYQLRLRHIQEVYCVEAVSLGARFRSDDLIGNDEITSQVRSSGDGLLETVFVRPLFGFPSC